MDISMTARTHIKAWWTSDIFWCYVVADGNDSRPKRGPACDGGRGAAEAEATLSAWSVVPAGWGVAWEVDGSVRRCCRRVLLRAFCR